MIDVQIVVDPTSPRISKGIPIYKRMISMCKPSKSWVARRIGLKSQNLCVGLYAVNLLD